MEAFEPFYDRVVLKIETEEKSSGGIHIPTAAQDKEASKARVLAIGTGKLDLDTGKYVPMQTKVGDLVYINAYLGMRVKISRTEQVLVQKEEEILGRVPQGATGG